MQIQKKLAAQILNCSPKKIRLDPDRLEDIKGSITKADIRSLIIDGAIYKVKKKGPSIGRSRHKKKKKSKGRRKGFGSRKGRKYAKESRKSRWINRIRNQKSLLKSLREKEHITKQVFRDLYLKAKGGFFRSRGHLKLYMQEHKLLKK